VETEIITYPVMMYDLYYQTKQIFNLADMTYLQELHKIWEPKDVFKRENDQKTPFHARFYHHFPLMGINDSYKNLIREVIQPYIGEDVVYQAIPSFRIQFPNNLAVGEKHKDSDYSHSKDEINFWLPLTDAKATNTLWIEDKPYPVKYGEILVFDGANKEHENKINKEGYTRVSLDFRVIPKSKYKPSDRKSINTNLPMSVGGYWAEL